MGFAFFRLEPGGQRIRPPLRDADKADSACARSARRKQTLGLTAADQLEINLRQQFRVDARAMLLAARQVDVEAPAEFIQRITRARKAPLRERNRVDAARHR